MSFVGTAVAHVPSSRDEEAGYMREHAVYLWLRKGCQNDAKKRFAHSRLDRVIRAYTCISCSYHLFILALTVRTLLLGLSK